MSTKSISSTIAQNNFGRILDDVVQNNAKYIIQRRRNSQAIIMSLSDFDTLLEDATARQELIDLVREVSPQYQLGKPLDSNKELGS